MRGYLEPRATEHGLHARAVRNPPVGPVLRVIVLDEVQLGISRIVEMMRRPEVVILFQLRQDRTAALQGLDHQGVTGSVLVDEIECEQRMPQMIEDTEEQD